MLLWFLYFFLQNKPCDFCCETLQFTIEKETSAPFVVTSPLGVITSIVYLCQRKTKERWQLLQSNKHNLRSFPELVQCTPHQHKGKRQ